MAFAKVHVPLSLNGWHLFEKKKQSIDRSHVSLYINLWGK